MKKRMFVIMNLLFPIVLNAGVVYWDQIYVTDNIAQSSVSGDVGDGMSIGWYPDPDAGSLGGDWYACLGLSIFYDKNNRDTITGITPGTSMNIMLASMSYWALAYANDVISESYVRNGRMFYDGLSGVGIDEKYGDTISVKNGDSLYLAFIAPIQSGTDSGDLLYGWVSLDVEDNQLTLTESAFSKDALYVGGGAVPEPSTGMLLLLGISVLGLRRRR